jgi:hypothetical protein
MLKMLIFVFMLISYGGYSEASSFGTGVHSGYGVIEYEEKSNEFDRKDVSRASLNTLIVGASAEYSFGNPEKYFAGVTTDWAFGLEDEERWDRNNAKFQTNDIKMFAQFYDVRLGYKNSVDRFYYRVYVSGGWDGIHFKRGDFVENGVLRQGIVTEDFNLWRTGGGIGLGYRFGKWALDGRAAYAYYPIGRIENSSVGHSKFETNGTCLDAGIGVAREINEKMKLYIGGSYTEIKLDRSDVKPHGNGFVVFPHSITQIIVGVINLTYSY